jgi:hypothetical protein
VAEQGLTESDRVMVCFQSPWHLWRSSGTSADSAVITPNAGFSIEASSITECQGLAGKAASTGLTTSVNAPLSGLSDHCSPGSLTNTLWDRMPRRLRMPPEPT